jgi:hypothetical protein
MKDRSSSKLWVARSMWRATIHSRRWWDSGSINYALWTLRLGPPIRSPNYATVLGGLCSDNGVINGVSRIMDQQRRLMEKRFKDSTAEVDKLSGKLGEVQAQLEYLTALHSESATTAATVDGIIGSVPENQSTADRMDGLDCRLVYGLHLEGCRWDDETGALAECLPKRRFSPLPIVIVKAVTVDKAEQKNSYACPVYKTRTRHKGALGNPDGGYIFTAGLHTMEPSSKWILSGVALLTDISGQ